MNTEQFISKAIAIHGTKFGYDHVVYGPKVQVTCFKHGDFPVAPDNHLYRKSGCPKCANEQSSIRYAYTTDEFIKKANKVHNKKYDYSKVEYKRSGDNVKIYCSEHDIFFEQSPRNHLMGQGCPQCGLLKRANSRRKPLQMYITEASAKHHGRYNYSNVSEADYIVGKIKIICQIHGEFQQNKKDHLYSLSGCTDCSLSKGELSIKQTLENLGVNFVTQKTFPDLFLNKKNCKLRYDFFLPDFNLLIEYDGEQHFEPRFSATIEEFESAKKVDLIKDTYAKIHNIALLRIPYTEFNNIDTIIKLRVKN